MPTRCARSAPRRVSRAPRAPATNEQAGESPFPDSGRGSLLVTGDHERQARWRDNADRIGPDELLRVRQPSAMRLEEWTW
jgi:hypothetical protein